MPPSQPSSLNQASSLERLMALLCDLSYQSIRGLRERRPLLKEAAFSGWQLWVLPAPSPLEDKAFTVIHPEEKAAVIVFKGSEPLPSVDVESIVKDWWISDLSMVAGRLPAPFFEALAYTQQVLQALPSGTQVYLTGHSLGGSLAELLAAMQLFQGVKAYTYNAYGVQHLLPALEAKGYAVACDFSHIHNFIMSADLVSNHQPHVGKVFVVPYRKGALKALVSILSEAPKVWVDIPLKLQKTCNAYVKALKWPLFKVDGHLMNNFTHRPFEYQSLEETPKPPLE